MPLPDIVKPGVVTGKALFALLEYAKKEGFAIPSVNCVTSSTVNACLEAAKKVNSPIMVQVSQGGGQFFGGKSVSNEGERASIAGSIAFAHHVRAVAPLYGVPVVLHSDHCAKKLLPWLDGMLVADEAYFATHGEPLFSSHMVDLSEEPLEENIELSRKYLERCAKVHLFLELELGITGGEEDGVDNTGVENSHLYSQPEDILRCHQILSAVSPYFTVAAAFGNVHGVYAPGNVHLHPEILGNAQVFVREHTKSAEEKPVFFVFHGGSGSEKDKIHEAISHGVIKMNIDTDTQWAYWDGVRAYEKSKHDYLQGQIGNPEGAEKPNKKQYDPRVWLREGEKTLVKRLEEAFADLKCLNRLA